MPVTIGSKESTFGDPLGLLSDCHRRIERFLRTLWKIIDEKGGRSLGGEYRRSLEAALKYFSEAAPKHTADEEEDLFPALRGAGRAHVEQILSRIDGLENDHNRADKWHRECDEIGKRWLRDEHLCLRDTARLRTVLLLLATLYQSHIAIEEREIFPVAQTTLSDEEKAAIGRSMADRRGIAFGAERQFTAITPG